jgi:hypothetical protein
MRPVSPLHPWYPDVRAVRIALASAAVAGLVVIAACTDSVDKNITAPKATAPRLASGSSGGFGNAKHVDLCVDVTSPAGTYSFVNSNENNAIALVGNGFHFTNPPFPFDAWKDGGDGGDGFTVFNDDGGPPPHVAPGANYTLTAGGPCVRVLDRTVANVDYDPNSAQEENRTDSYAGVTISHVSNSVGAVYDHTDCTLDVGVIPPEHTISPLPAAYSAAATYAVNDRVTTNGGNKVWRALLANGPGGVAPGAETSTWTNSGASGDCGSSSNPTRAFANFEHGTVITFHFTSAPILEPCVLGYPYTSANSRTSADFNESEVLTGFQLIGSSLHGWYTDEHAMTLGVDSIFIDNKAPKPDSAFGINTLPLNPDGNSYQIETMVGHATSATTAAVTGSPLIKIGRVGTTTKPVGQGNAIDPAGRPLFPALYITDITGLADNLAHTDPAIRAGDWQYSSGIGIPNIPSAVYGTWKAAVLKIDNTKTPPATTLVNRADPAKNHKVVGAGGVNPPAGAIDNGYSSDVVWDLANLHDNNNLALVAGNRYRAQFIVHDGDQNKTGGDVGQACVNLTR